MSTDTQPGSPNSQPGSETDADVIAATRKNNTRGKVLTASMVGTTIEFFDFYAYATASSLVFPALFFPHQTSTTQLLSSFAIFGVAFVARPLGSIIFGHFGDRIGRKKTLIASLLIMGIGTFLIGLLPTATTPGWIVLAPLFLVLLRFCQGVGLGGEWSGAALLATENAPKGKRAIWGTFPQLGAPVGFIIANLLFVGLNAWTSPEAFLAWGWRVPFLLSALLVAVGLYVRMSLMETPAFQLVAQKQQISKAPIGRVFRSSWKPLILGTFIMFATYVIFYFMTAFTLTYGTSPATTGQAQAAAEAAGTTFDPTGFVAGLGYSKNEFLTYLIIGVVFFGIFTVVSGPLAEKLGRRKMLMGVTILIAAYGIVVNTLFNAGTVGVIIALIIGFILMGLTFGPMAAYLPELFPANVRYTGSAVSYNMSSVIGAGPAPFAMVALWQAEGGTIFYCGLYIIGAAILTFIALFLAKDTSQLDLEDQLS
ncbi:Predicted arabinose efflux permease, MFS family [Brevibacterium sandarakinum]|uniref:Predicted arabinose efflux permease, MFS family n=1 Tax=Brevibacterium sandarakinum TaxID=629680 RepID=A0A1H1NRH0_BRESA|nr:MFS transporter [Brevibacterium sandarakinum]SDS01390.1 Predicted arabinose efflux permease, MFS family [Brevibacterium sandarakinum]